MKHSLYISPIFSLGIVAPLRHVLTRGNCQLNYGQKHLKCPSEHRTPNDLIRRNRSLQRFRVDSFSASDGCCQGMADPVPIVRTFMSSPEVTCSWTCLKAFKFGCSLEICCDLGARAELRLDAAGDPGFAKNFSTKIPTSSESTRQVITMTDCKNLLGRLDDTIEEGKA